jgi:hypothetical protein
MRLKKYLEFIKESVKNDSMYWISEDEIKDIFKFITDEGYPLSITKVLFGHSGYSEHGNNHIRNSKELVLFDINQDDVVLRGEEYMPGYRISIIISQSKGDNVTDEFRSAISQLKGEGYVVDTVEDEDGKTNLENIHLLDGSIVTWIPETPNKPFTTDPDEMSDGDVYISSSELVILVHQPEEVKFTEKMLAEIYDWKCDRIEGDKIYCHVDIEDMARSVLSRRDYERWGKMLEEGIDIDNYYGEGYYPDISSVFQYTLNKEATTLLVKVIIKELGGLESALTELEGEEIYESLSGKSEDEVIDILLKERFKRSLEKLSQDSEIMSTVRETIADWERQAHCDANWDELISEFDEIVSDVTEYTKLEKEVDKYYMKKDTREKVWYKSVVTHYEIPFQDKWIEEYGKSLRGYSLDALFQEWCSDEYLDYKLEPRFNDWGDVDSDALNKEIISILNYNLKS